MAVLGPGARAIIDTVKAAGIRPVHTMSVPEAREALRQRRSLHAMEVENVARVEDLIIRGGGGQDLRLRVYAHGVSTPSPVLVYFHGGGFVLGDLETSDPQCRELARESGCVVVSVEYRNAPEHKYPSAVLDAYAAIAWARVHALEIGGDGERLAIGGDSAGGSLAVAAALMARDRGWPHLAFQLIVYPLLGADLSRASYLENADGYILTTADVRWFWSHYLVRADDAMQPYAAPLSSTDFRGLPPALVIAAHFDPLRDDAIEYAAQLKRCGVPTTLLLYATIHGFFGMPKVLPEGRAAIDDAARALRKALAPGEATAVTSP